MFKSNIGLRLTKSAGLILFVIACQGLMSDRVNANNADHLVQENINIAQDIELDQIKVYCSTILNPQLLQELFPDLVIETKILSDEKAAELITCPEEKTVFIIKATNQDNLIAQRKEIIETITKFYIDNGYITSRAMPYGTEDILLEEDRAIITIEGATRLEKYVLMRITPATNPFNTKDIEERLRLLKADSLFENIEATLKPAEETNATELVVKVTEAKSFFGSFGIDNDSPPSIGSEELNLILGDRNLTGIGDSLAIFYSPRLEAFTDTYDLNFDYRAPINSMNGTINLGINLNRNEIVDGEFEDFDIQGESETYSLNYRQPVILSPRQELALSVGFSYRDGQTFLLQNGFPFGEGPDEDGVSRTSVFNIGQEYILRQASGAWGIRSLFRIGVDLFDATNNDSSVPDSQFFSNSNPIFYGKTETVIS